MKKIPVFLFAICILVLGQPGSAYSQDVPVYNAFLYLEGIQGESTDHYHKDEIDVLSWSWQMSSSSTMTLGVASGFGEVIIRPIIIIKQIDKSSPLISLNLLKGSVITEAVLKIAPVLTAGDSFDVVRITMKNVRIVHQCVEGEGTTIREKVALSFGSICYRYIQLKLDGSPGTVIEKCWDLEAHTEF